MTLWCIRRRLEAIVACFGEAEGALPLVREGEVRIMCARTSLDTDV